MLAFLLVACGERTWTRVVPTEEILRLEAEVVDHLTVERSKHGLSRLVVDPHLADVARGHSQDMVQGRFFAHESPRTGDVGDRLVWSGYAAKIARENLAWAGDVASAHAGWMKSPGHRLNLLADDVSHVGVGIVRDAKGALMITQVFATPLRHPGVEEMAQGLHRDLAARSGGRLARERALDEAAAAVAERLRWPVQDRALADAVAQVRRGDLGQRALRVQVFGGENLERLALPDDAVTSADRSYGLAVRAIEVGKARRAALAVLLVGD